MKSSPTQSQCLRALSVCSETELEEKREILERVLREYFNWCELVESEQIETLSILGEEFHYLDILSWLRSLTPLQLFVVHSWVMEGAPTLETGRCFHVVSNRGFLYVLLRQSLDRLLAVKEGIL